MDTLLALDLGTSGCRAEFFGLDGQSLARCHREYGLLSPEPGAAEQDSETWWRSLAACVRDARGQFGEAAVLAIGVSAQGHSWVPVDAQLHPLRNALTWLDARSGAQGKALLERYGAAFWGALAGKLPGQWHMLPQLLWLREREQDCLADARHLLCAHDYLVARLTGEVITDATNAATTLLFDIAAGEWSARLLTEHELDAALLPEVLPAGSLAGKLTAAAASELGLAVGTPVAVGAQDQKCAALAAGLGDGTATASLGTATALIARTDAPRFSAEHGAIPCFPYLQPGQWVLEAPLATTGGAVRWLRDAMATSYDDMIAAAAAVPPGSAGVLFFPYLAGAAAPFWQGDAHAAFCGLTLATGLGHMTRAVLESVAYDLRANLDHMQALGCAIERLVLFGGGARSALWTEIIAAVSDRPVLAGADAEAASRGAAMLAAQAIGRNVSPLKLRVQPVPVRPEWRAAYAPLREVFARARDLYFTFDEHLRGQT
ncbi:MAG: hypothetical protein KKI08_18170 [Armatimonadetes bacterium]|nr:hypothetical protein [Armatimonadota bacterium]